LTEVVLEALQPAALEASLAVAADLDAERAALADFRRFDRDLSRSQVFLLAKPLM
jgi:hypothetical protein